MKKQILDNAEVTSSSKQIAILKQHFPACFDKDGKFMPDKLAKIAQAEGADISREGYSLNWLGKSYARLMANLNTETLLAANKEHNAKDENKASENILIQGDNLDVLKHLKNAYSEQIKMIYIDPPYNTGSDGFVYQDDRKFTVGQLTKLAGIDEEEAKRILAFTASKSSSHSAWLTFMFPRLYIAKELLSEDGVIFISIGEDEHSQLKILCEEIFGEQNFISSASRIAKRTSNKGTHFRPTKDYVLVFAKHAESLNEFGVKKMINEKDYKYREDNGRKYKKSGASLYQPSLDSRPNQRYYIEAPDGSLIIPPGNIFPDEKKDGAKIKPASNADKVWRWSVDSYLKQKDLLIFTEGSDKNPLLDELGSQSKWNIYPKVYLDKDSEALLRPEDVIYDFPNSQGTKELLSLEIPFSFSKPSKLVEYLFGLTGQNDGIFLDFFAGSGTTAHAVMGLNAKDGGNRKYITVQIDEATDENSEARKLDYNTVFEITRERIIRSAKQLRKKNPATSCDFGFKEFKAVPVFDGYLGEADTPDQYNIFDGDKLTVEQRSQLLLTWQVYDGLPITLDLLEVDLKGYAAHQGHHILYCINSGLSLDHILKMCPSSYKMAQISAWA